MNFKTKKLAIATAAAFAMGAAGQAQSTDLLFPYVVVSNTVTTIVNVINTNTNEFYDNNASGAIPRLHYRLLYKNGANASDNSATCAEVDVERRTSGFDIQTIDLGAMLDNTLGVMFDDPSINNDWEGAGQSFALAGGLTKPVRGYVTVDDQTLDNPNMDGDPSGTNLRGEATVFEFQSGAQWGYQAGAGESNQVTPADFTDPDLGLAFGPQGVNSRDYWTLPVSLLPWGQPGDPTGKVAQTRFFVTPLIDNMRNGNNTFSGDAVLARVSFVREMDGTSSIVGYDRDENPVSGSAARDVRCVGAVDAEQLVTEGAWLETSGMGPNGGWAFLSAQGRLVDGLTNYAASDTVSVSIIKLEFNDGSVPFAGTSAGVFNNAFQLRNADLTEIGD